MVPAAAIVLVLMCLAPGGALREDSVPQQRMAPVAAHSSADGCAAFALTSGARLCGSSQSRSAAAVYRRPTQRMVSGRSLLPVAFHVGRLQLRRGAMVRGRTGPLYMTEKEKTEKTPEEIADLNEKLWAAAEAGNAELIRQLVEEGADVNSAPFVADEEDDDDEDSSYTTATSTTEISQEQSQPEATVASDGTVEKPTEETPEERKKRKKKEKARKKKLAAANKGPSALHRACEKGHSDAACALVDLGADVNSLTCELSTPLHVAVEGGCQDTVQVLVTLGADLKAKNQDGETAVAVGKRVETDKEVIEFLEQFMGLVDQD